MRVQLIFLALAAISLLCILGVAAVEEASSVSISDEQSQLQLTASEQTVAPVHARSCN